MRVVVFTLLIVIASALALLWFFTNYERVAVQRPATYQGEARFNDFLAAEMLLREMGFAADSRASLTPSVWLPDIADTLFVRMSASIATAKERGLLDAWVAAGGHLVLLPPEQPTRLTDDALEYFGFRLVDTEFANAPYADERILNARPGPESGSYTVKRFWLMRSLEIATDHFEGAMLSDEYGIAAVRRRWGNGFVTVIAGYSLFENAFLPEADHARLLLDSVAGYVDPRMVWLIYDASFPPLWQIIWDNGSYVVVGIALTLLLWLWSVIPRFGPIVAAPEPVRRSIIEHVNAAGRFIWRSHGASLLAAGSTAAVVHRAESRHPGINRLPPNEQAVLIAKMTDTPAQAVISTLSPCGRLGQREFTRKIQALQEMRNEL